MLDQLYFDVLNMIVSYLNEKDIIQLLKTCKSIYKEKHHFLYHFIIDVNQVKYLSYFNHFKKLHYDCTDDNEYPAYGNRVCSLLCANKIIDPVCWKHITRLNVYYFDGLHQFENLTHLKVKVHQGDKLFSEDGQTMIPKVKHLEVSCGSYEDPNMLMIDSDGNIKSFISAGVQSLKLDFFRSTNIQHLIPDGVKDLTFVDIDVRLFYNNTKFIPESVVCLDLGDYFRGNLIMNNGKSALPSNLKKLILGISYNKSLIGALPSSLEKLCIGDEFNQSLYGHLPEGLIHLTLGFYFKHKLPKMPSSLRYLELGFGFNNSIDKLNDDLHTLILGVKFVVKVSRLPTKLKVLQIYDTADPSIIGCLPEGIEKVVIKRMSGFTTDVIIRKFLPDGKKWPKSIQHLIIHDKTIIV